jgi:hypothetical protein
MMETFISVLIVVVTPLLAWGGCSLYSKIKERRARRRFHRHLNRVQAEADAIKRRVQDHLYGDLMADDPFIRQARQFRQEIEEVFGA